MADNIYQVTVPFSGFSVRKTGKTEKSQGRGDEDGIAAGSFVLIRPDTIFHRTGHCCGRHWRLSQGQVWSSSGDDQQWAGCGYLPVRNDSRKKSGKSSKTPCIVSCRYIPPWLAIHR